MPPGTRRLALDSGFGLLARSSDDESRTDRARERFIKQRRNFWLHPSSNEFDLWTSLLEFRMTLPIAKDYLPMEAQPATSLPAGLQWQYEPKWDGFRCLAFRDGKRIDLQSKSGKPLTRYFPELISALGALRAAKFVLDGEIVIPVDGNLSFDQLLMRIHPSASRVEKLSREIPCMFIVFDLLVSAEGKSLADLPLEKRRQELDRFAAQYLKKDQTIRLSPYTVDLSVARKWFHMGTSVDGVVAKRRDLPYQSGTRN